ncbi:MAG: GNAT family N-acetyltransferase [Tepidisphaerales bacterium]
MPDATPRSPVRHATPDDVPEIVAMIHELAEYEKLAHACRASADDLRQHLFPTPPARAYCEALIAEHAGQPVGFALFFHNYSTFLTRPGIYLEDLYVRPAFRGRGLGKALLIAVARLAVHRGCGRVEWSVLDWNAPSIAFYTSLGAVAMDDWTTYRLTGDALARLGQSTP